MFSCFDAARGLHSFPTRRSSDLQEHAAYLDAFVERLALTDVILVMQDWGGGLGFDYACRHPHNVKGLVFMECLTGPRLWADFTLSERMFFRIVRSPIGKWLVVDRNFWIEKFLPKIGRAHV